MSAQIVFGPMPKSSLSCSTCKVEKNKTHSLNKQARLLSGTRYLYFCLILHLYPYFDNMSSECSDGRASSSDPSLLANAVGTNVSTGATLLLYLRTKISRTGSVLTDFYQAISIGPAQSRVGISGTTAKSRQRKFVPSSHPGPFAAVATSRKSQTKVGTLACFDLF